MVVTASHDQRRITFQRILQTVLIQIAFPKSDIDKRNSPTLPFDQRVCCQRC